MDSLGKPNQQATDLVALVLMLWNKRKRLIINCVWGGILSIIIAFSIPKEYTSTVVLAPEIAGTGNLTGGLGTLASMAGINMDVENEAIYPELYPQIVSSTPFLCDLLPMSVSCLYKGNSVTTSLYNYLSSYQKHTWWSRILSLPGKMVRLIKHEENDTIGKGVVLDPRRLSKRQQIILKGLNDRISVELDKNSSAISIRVRMQDPVIASEIAESVTDNLQDYVCNYRTAKARKDLENTQRLFDEARENYYNAQKTYAEYCDKHQGVTKLQYLVEQDRLSNEQELAFSLYNQVAQQLDLCKAKLLEKTPVVVVLQPATLPYKATTPRKMLIGLLFVFLAFFGTAAWYIVEDCISKH